MSTLKVNKLRDTAGSADAIVLDPNGGAVLAGVTTVTSVKVGAAVTISESGIEASGIGITVANINGGAISGRRNMIINGDQRIAQRGTAAVTVNSSALYRCVDRFKTDIDGSGGGDWSHEQSTDVPTGQGFTHSSKITTVTQASQPTSEGNRNQLYHILEKQDVAHLEWGTSAAKTCTLSFWVKGSITGTYPLWFGIYTGTTNYYYTNYTIDSANTWEKKVITLTGPTSGGVVSGTTDTGLRIEWGMGYGSDSETGALNTWVTSSTTRTAAGSVYLPENAGATWYITGIQFEVGSQATAFEHRSFAEELALCQRYYFLFCEGNNKELNVAWYYTGSHISFILRYPTTMRVAPTLTVASGTDYYILYRNGSNDKLDDFASEYVSTEQMSCFNNSDMSGTGGQAGILRTYNSSAKVEMSAEL